jgi:hypothetical protein
MSTTNANQQNFFPVTTIKLEGLALQITVSKAVRDMFPLAVVTILAQLPEETTLQINQDSSATITTAELDYLVNATAVIGLTVWYAHHADTTEEYLAPCASIATMITDVRNAHFKGGI